MKHNLIWLTIILAFLLISATTYGQKVELKFSHQKHMQDVGASCTDCHAAADTSALPAQNLLPDMETCYNCHDSDTECTVCHKDPDNAVVYPRITSYIASFPHVKHVQKEIKCSTCHAGVENSTNIFDKHLPGMATCTDCHNDLEQVDYCQTCHAAGEDLRPADHKSDWNKGHGFASQTDDDKCKTCHTDNQCLDCHQKDDLDHKVHPLNFRNNHALFAKGNLDNCYTCHEELSFCVDCHRQELVIPRNHARAGWSNPETGGSHARVAKYDLDSCISCHNDPGNEPICIQCHQEK